MRGTMHTASISERSGGQWVATSSTWRCRLEPISPKVRLEGSRYPTMTHLAIGKGTPEITEGMRLSISRGSTLLGIYYVLGVHKMERPGHGGYSQEIYLSSAAD
jgi:hypothetical protein